MSNITISALKANFTGEVAAAEAHNTLGKTATNLTSDNRALAGKHVATVTAGRHRRTIENANLTKKDDFAALVVRADKVAQDLTQTYGLGMSKTEKASIGAGLGVAAMIVAGLGYVGTAAQTAVTTAPATLNAALNYVPLYNTTATAALSAGSAVAGLSSGAILATIGVVAGLGIAGAYIANHLTAEPKAKQA